jgi:hypothetical protein
MSKHNTKPDDNVIPGFRKMSKLRIFNMAVRQIAGTRVKSTFGINQGCRYGGSGCNARPLLRAESVEQADKIGGWDSLVEAGFVPRTNAEFIRELQGAHDGACNFNFMDNWAFWMRKLAEKYGLSTAALDRVAL